MSFQNDSQAFCLAVTYGFNPPRPVYPARLRNTDPGKYEPDDNVGSDSRCMILAHYSDATNVLIQYNPNDLEYE